MYRRRDHANSVLQDRTIIATAIPRITDVFNSLGDVAWYASSYLLTFGSFQLLFGRIYTFYNPKWVLISAIVIFEIGSAVCGAAPTSTALIIGRAVAGLGAAGIFGGVVIILIHAVPLHKRPMFQGKFAISCTESWLTGSRDDGRRLWNRFRDRSTSGRCLHL